MPRPAVDRLLEVSGFRNQKNNNTISTSSSKGVQKRSMISKNRVSSEVKIKKQSTDTEDKKTKDNTGKTKTEASTYYHFASTPAEQAAKFQPKKITSDDAQSKQFDNAIGASKWNPGNTFEDRDYTNLANNTWLDMMKEF